MPSEVISDELIRHYEVILLWTRACRRRIVVHIGKLGRRDDRRGAVRS